MTARPMTEELEAVDIACAIVSAEATTPGVVIPRCQKNLLILARALLSTSAAVRGMRDALERARDIIERARTEINEVYLREDLVPDEAIELLGEMKGWLSALSGIEPGEDEQATRADDGPTAPTDRL